MHRVVRKVHNWHKRPQDRQVICDLRHMWLESHLDHIRIGHRSKLDGAPHHEGRSHYWEALEFVVDARGNPAPFAVHMSTENLLKRDTGYFYPFRGIDIPLSNGRRLGRLHAVHAYYKSPLTVQRYAIKAARSLRNTTTHDRFTLERNKFRTRMLDTYFTGTTARLWGQKYHILAPGVGMLEESLFAVRSGIENWTSLWGRLCQGVCIGAAYDDDESDPALLQMIFDIRTGEFSISDLFLQGASGEFMYTPTHPLIDIRGSMRHDRRYVTTVEEE